MSDGKELAAYDPEKLMDSVKAKIRSEFVNLMPDSAWSALVKKSMDSFFDKKQDYYGRQQSQSEFDTLVVKLVNEDAQKRIQAILAGPAWASQWENGEQLVSEAMAKLITENAAQIVARLLGQAMQGVVSQMQMQVR